MKITQGYATLQESMLLQGFIKGKDYTRTMRTLEEGTRVFALVEQTNNSITTSIRTDDEFLARIDGNLFNEQKLKR